MLKLQGIDEKLKSLITDYPIHVFCLKDLQEEYFHTNLRELIGLMKRQKNKEELRKYCKDNEEWISRMDASAYDMICIMLNREDLLEKKTKYLKEESEEYDMCKAMEDWAEECRNGKSEFAGADFQDGGRWRCRIYCPFVGKRGDGSDDKEI